MSVPVSIQTLESLMELLYTGETQASHSELDKIKVGLNLLGILHPGQGHQPDTVAVPQADGGVSPHAGSLGAGRYD